jgi:hypothetical protein
MLPLLAFLLIVPFDAVSAEPPPRTDAVDTPWAVVLDDDRLRLERDRTIRFEGRGHLVFDAGRRHVHVETDAPLLASVDGTAVRGPHPLAAGDVLGWRAGADTWTVRLASTRELNAVTDATFIYPETDL